MIVPKRCCAQAPRCAFLEQSARDRAIGYLIPVVCVALRTRRVSRLPHFGDEKRSAAAEAILGR
jgi:hypothetical protein